MGTVTPNISIYVPAAGETNYDASFAAGMVNIDQHDHSGGPNKGVPIASSGLADGSVTYSKLASDVADTTTGIGTSGSLGANQLSILGLLQNIYKLATASGFISKDGSLAHARTITGTSGQIDVTNGDGVGGDPVISIDPVYIANAGSLIKLQTLTASASSTLNFVSQISSTYQSYFVVVENLTFVASTGYLQIKFSTDNGATWLNSGYQGGCQTFPCNQTPTNGTNSNSAGFGSQLIPLLSQGSSSQANGNVYLFGVGSALQPTLNGNFTTGSPSGTMYNEICCGGNTSTGVNAIRFYPSTGTFGSGTITLYGIKQ